MTAQLTTITETADLKALRELYEQEWPKHCVGHFWLDNYVHWLAKEPQLKHLKFYTLNGDWRRDGLFILVHRYQLFFSNLSRQRTPELRSALGLLNWTVGYKVSALHQTHHSIYKEFQVERGLCLEREMKTIMYRLPCEKANELQINCPFGYYLDSVRLEHADLINDRWSARHPGSLKLIQLLIENNTSVGLYEQKTDQLCAWCLRLQSGFLGALEVLPTHQRRGFGMLIVAAISKDIACDLNQDVTALVNIQNPTACRVFDKLDFELLSDEHYFWSMCLPRADGSIKWPANE
ncbi:uncharacterized protein LOC6562000 [Drosophila grimshawi]|uniref:GH11202 n=1 Tax=Drosophila grimshawi TaxID=7222 RepID=B4JDJ9_DROGR|nr:uncharacterized protein LOC6562000 [Drosophila grimshawi]EDW03369.1 GH11202 [Drosophila grimshawi]